VTEALVLALPNFAQPFIIECDASGVEVGAVLMQDHHPISFLSQALKGEALHISTYEKELFALVTTVHKWRPYLIGQSFVVRTDQQNLKLLLEQKVGTPFQQRWLSKLLGYDFLVEYKKGVENKVSNALSRKDSAATEFSLSILSIPILSWVDELKAQYLVDPKLQLLLAQWHSTELNTRRCSLRDDFLLYKNKIFLGDSQQLKAQVLLYVHGDPMAGHSGYEKTLHRVKRDFYWRGMRKDIKKFIRECDTCQQNKHDNLFPAGLLQPLPIPSRVWTDIPMDFVEGLPVSQGHLVIFVVVDHLSKYAHFIPLSPPLFCNQDSSSLHFHVFKLNGIPNSIVSDWDPTFTNTLWGELFCLQGTTLKLSTSYHPQIDGQIEIVNKAVENYLSCFTQDSPKNWSSWLP